MPSTSHPTRLTQRASMCMQYSPITFHTLAYFYRRNLSPAFLFILHARVAADDLKGFSPHKICMDYAGYQKRDQMIYEPNIYNLEFVLYSKQPWKYLLEQHVTFHNTSIRTFLNS